MFGYSYGQDRINCDDLEMRRKGKYMSICLSSNDKYHDLQPQSSFYIVLYYQNDIFLIPPGPGIFCQSQYFKKLLTEVHILPIKLSEGSSLVQFVIVFSNLILQIDF